jgi:hypothetical protein
MKSQAVLDPIDELIPPPRPRWLRLVTGLVVVSVVGIASYLWGNGYFYPSPGCCGGGTSGTQMWLAPDGKAVVITASFYNTSGRTLIVESAKASLPGATVSNVSLLSTSAISPIGPDGIARRVTRSRSNGVTYPAEPITWPRPTTALPLLLAGSTPTELAITFVPDRCDDTGGAWGTVMVQLDVDNGWLPSIGRRYTLPNPIAELGVAAISPDGHPATDKRTPLAAACVLLGRT